MYIKIYFGNKLVFLCDDIDSYIHEFLHHPDTVFIDKLSGPAIKSLLHEIVKSDFHAGIIWNKDLKNLKKSFWKHFTVIQAAGGLVENEKGEILMIFRRGKWDLPKGKLEKGEKLETCAIREVQEETGLTGLRILEALPTTFHTYDEFGKHILKESYWFRMRTHAAQKMKPQTEEEIHAVQWVRPDELKGKLANSYPSIVDLIQLAGVPT